MGKWFGPPDSNAPQWWNRPATRIIAGLLGVALLILLLSGCGGGTSIDEATWRADVEAVDGSPVADWQTFRDVYVDDVCTGDIDFFVALSMDDQVLDRTLVSIRHACPERLPELVDAVAAVGGF